MVSLPTEVNNNTQNSLSLFSDVQCFYTVFQGGDYLSHLTIIIINWIEFCVYRQFLIAREDARKAIKKKIQDFNQILTTI